MSLVGRQIGRYRILEQLGSGGMSVVYKGLDTALDREVAVKVLHPHLSGKDESRRRLAREAKAVAKLHHPNILEVFDFSSVESGDAYIVTEYIRGKTLRELTADQSFDPPEIGAMVAHELAAALAHAHELGVIHRDLKPENVMVRDDGVLKLMDFGIAKMVDRDERMTVTGALVGSPAHMAPEIIEGEEAGPEADIFSLGTMLYLFATGKLPFVAGNTTATLKRILDGAYDDPRQLAPRISDDLAEIISTCLARSPSDRYADAGKLRDALATYLSELGIEHVSEEVAAFFAEPQVYRKALPARLVARLLDTGQQLWTAGRTPKALAALNHALALEPSNQRALALLVEMNVVRARQRRLSQSKQLGLAGVAALALGVSGFAAYRAWSSRPLGVKPIERLAQATAPVALRPTPVPNPTTSAPSPKAETKRAVTHVIALPKPAPVPVQIQVKPFGFIQVDNGPVSDQELSQHQINLPIGAHRITVTCHFCVPTKIPINVTAELGQEFHAAAQLKPSRLSFDYQPPEAVVRVGTEERPAKDTQQRPFDIRTPQGPRPGRHHVEFEISLPGFKTLHDVAELEPEQAVTLSGKLESE